MSYNPAHFPNWIVQARMYGGEVIEDNVCAPDPQSAIGEAQKITVAKAIEIHVTRDHARSMLPGVDSCGRKLSGASCEVCDNDE